jgi:hypothetical protein
LSNLTMEPSNTKSPHSLAHCMWRHEVEHATNPVNCAIRLYTDNSREWDGADRRSSTGSPSPLRSLAACSLRLTARATTAGFTGIGALAWLLRESSSHCGPTL